MRSIATVLVLALSAYAEPPRAEPPEFSQQDQEPFAGDGFAQLQGERPAAPEASEVSTPAAAAAGMSGWADLVEADVLETEVKRQATALAEATRSATAFKGGGYREASDALTVVATLFAIIAEHPDEPRWRDAAASLRDHFAAGATAADGGTDEAFAAAAARAADLADLVRGGRPAVPEAQAQDVDWGKVAARVPLMKRMYVAEEERLKPWVASERELKKNADGLRHETQLLAALAEASIRPGAPDGDDPDYQAYARQLQEASRRLAAAAEAEDQPAAAEGMGGVAKSCMDCHGDYRG